MEVGERVSLKATSNPINKAGESEQNGGVSNTNSNNMRVNTIET